MSTSVVPPSIELPRALGYREAAAELTRWIHRLFAAAAAAAPLRDNDPGESADVACRTSPARE